jgi:hypothetical protein
LTQPIPSRCIMETRKVFLVLLLVMTKSLVGLEELTAGNMSMRVLCDGWQPKNDWKWTMDALGSFLAQKLATRAMFKALVAMNMSKIGKVRADFLGYNSFKCGHKPHFLS